MKNIFYDLIFKKTIKEPDNYLTFVIVVNRLKSPHPKLIQMTRLLMSNLQLLITKLDSVWLDAIGK